MKKKTVTSNVPPLDGDQLPRAIIAYADPTGPESSLTLTKHGATLFCYHYPDEAAALAHYRRLADFFLNPYAFVQSKRRPAPRPPRPAKT